MKGKVRTIILALLMIAIMAVLGACGSKGESGVYTGSLAEALEDKIVINTDNGSKEFKTGDDTEYDLGSFDEMNLEDVVDVNYHEIMGGMYADKVTLREHKAKDQVFAGTVVEAADTRLTVTGKSLTVTFVCGDDTDVEGKLKAGDEVEIIYTGDISEYPFATNVKVISEAEAAEEAAGEEAKEEAKANKEAADKESTDKKDEAKEESEAKKDEKKEEAKASTVSGIVSEFTETSVLIAIDSAHSYRFTLDKNTRITGVAKYLRIGDSVNVTFKGDISKKPVASEINIVKEAQEEKRTVNGTIQSVAKDYLTLNTGKKVYMIHFDKNTKYKGDKPAKGYKSEITYTGNLSSGKALATNIYCVKQTPAPVIYTVTFTDGNGNTITKVKVEAGKAAAAPANPTREGYTFNGWDKSFSKVTGNMTVNALWVKEAEPAPEPAPDPAPEEDKILTDDVTITAWTTDTAEDPDTEAEGDFIKVRNSDGTEYGLNIIDDLEIAPGYFPVIGDKVRITYYDKSMNLIKIELLEKAVVEPEDKTEPDEKKEEPEEKTEPEEQSEPAEEAQPEEKQKEPAEEAKPEEKQEEPAEEAKPEEKQEEPAEEAKPEEKQEEPAEEPKPEEKKEEPAPEPDVFISGHGVVQQGNEAKQIFTIEIDGKKIDLNVTGDSKVAAGYFPEPGDTVRVTYNKKGMVLKEIQLINRPAPEPAPEEGEGESESMSSDFGFARLERFRFL